MAIAKPHAYLEPLSATPSKSTDNPESDQGIVLLTLDRPEAKNAIGRQMLSEFQEALEKVKFDKYVQVVFVFIFYFFNSKKS